ncbi:MAG: site-specific integrase [Myxococcales bacterium]
MASLRVDRSKTPRVWWIHYRDPDGTQRTRKLADCDTKPKAKRRLIEVEARLGRKQFGDPRDEPKKAPVQLVTTCIETWSHTLKNRNRVSDGQQARKHLVSSAALVVPLDQFSIRTVKAFVRELAASTLGGGSQKRLFGLLARWCSWAVGEELIAGNPCRDLPWGQRPVYDRGDPTAKPWVQTDKELAKLMGALPRPLDLALWLGNRSGLRLGETFGLRLSDLADTSKGYIRVARSFGGPLKESKAGHARVKHPPIQPDVAEKLNQLASERRAAGGGRDDLLFVPLEPGKRQTDWKGYLPHTVNAVWRTVQTATGFRGTWKDATRHSFASRNIVAGVSVHAVSHALGHSSVAVTEKNYAHIIRVVYPEGLLASGQLAGPEPKTATHANARKRAAVG